MKKIGEVTRKNGREKETLPVWEAEKPKRGQPRWLSKLPPLALDPSWLLHAGKLRLVDGTECLVSEPFALTQEDLEALARDARKFGLRYEIRGTSHTLPSETFRILVCLKD